MFKSTSFAIVAALITGVAAQTTTSCNPLTNSTCSDDIALNSVYSYSFTDGEDSNNWSSVGSGNISYTSNGAEFTINEKGDAPTIASEWYIFFGRVEVHMKAANGTGIVSSAVLLSDDLDEIDWEWLGGESDNVQTNYFYQGNSSSTAGESDTTISDSQGTSHNYTVDWTKESCIWYIDGTAIRTLAYSDDDYPQTPMQIKLGIWAGGDSDNAEGTIEWAGGETDYDDAPFTMIVESIKVTNYNPGASYTYSDQTGSYGSITINESDDDSSSSSVSTTTTTTTATAITRNSTSTSTTAAFATTLSASSTTNTPTSQSTVSALADTTGTSSGSSATPTAPVTSSGFAISASVWVTFAAVAAVFLGQL